MQYLLQIIGVADDVSSDDGDGPTAEEFISWQQALVGAGVLLSGGFLGDYQLATSVQINRGEQIITNGPFPESREYLGGWSIIDVPDLDAALEWATSCPGAKYGRVEVRPVMG